MAWQGAENGIFVEFSLCLSRACLGKIIVFIYKWLKNAVFRRTLPYPGEVYARWLQYCSLGTVTRIHSAPSLSRLPWEFGAVRANTLSFLVRF